MAERDPAAAAAQKYKPIQSAVPGTTLGPIQINAFLGGGKLYDTPGVHLHHRQAAVVHSEDLPVLAPRSRLRGQSFPAASKNGMVGTFNSNGLKGFSIFWGGLVRIDVLEALPETCLIFYGPKGLRIHVIPTDEADEFYKKELGVLLTPPTGKDKADEWRGLETVEQLKIKFEDAERPATDVAISGLGWITIEPKSKSFGISESNIADTINELHLAVHVPKPVEVFVRPPIPVGKAGAEWYQYRAMHIKEICLEGFKSYATRTVVPGFDPFFNAITGLNGSGKSNILDSICFVLGITNLQQVRAANLQELVYKQGQAGITKATVSVIFDNSDRSRSPLGYEDHSEITVTRQIVVGGRNKYLINGKLAQPSQVQNLFHSVQLNVNNPHFLIMQGRITKVLNMKPPEILSMLEEAAGTRMYETKKEFALKTLEKKQSKVDEINKLLDQEILPALEKLRKERTQYMQWANGNAELDRLKRFCVAYEYVQAERIRDSAVGEVERVKAKIMEIDNDTERTMVEIQDMETNIAKLTAEREATMGGEVKTLSDEVDLLSKNIVQEVSVLHCKEDTLKGEKENAEKIVQNIEDLRQSIEEKGIAVQKSEEGAADLKKRVEDLSKSLEENEREYQAVQAGKNSGNEEKCLEDQLVDAKVAVGTAETELKQLKTKITHCEKELGEKTRQLMSKREEAVGVENELNSRRNDVERIQTELESLPYKEGQMEALQKDRASELEMIQKLKDGVRDLSARLSNVQFTYRDPEKNFDRSRVKGVVAKLIKVKDSSTMTALEVTAGGKLYNVVVDTENTGKQLLQKGDLRRRVTIIPLNKIQPNTVPPRVQQAAIRLVGKENAKLALSLVGYDKELESAMEYVFGANFVCKTTDAAKEVAFSREIRTPSVTLEGDIFQPSGLLTGGSRRGGGDLLRQLHDMAECESKLSVHQKRLSEIEAKIADLLPLQKRFMDLKAQLELKMHDLSLFQSRAEKNEHHKLGEMVKSIEKDLEEAKSAIKEKQSLYEKHVSKVLELEKSIREHDNSREGRLKDLERKIKATKSQMQSDSKDLKRHENERERLVMEREAVVQEQASLESQLASLRTQINNLNLEVDEQLAKVNSIKKNRDQLQSQLDSIRLKMKECDSQISSILKEQQKLQHKLSETKLQRKKLENEVKQMEMEQKDCSTKVDKLIEKHAWIATEKQLFGRSGTDYDFASRDPRKAREELDKLQAEQSSLEKRVNKKVMAMFEKAEDEYNDLMSKKNTVENDKSKIKKTIEELDEKKKETLKVTWVKVNNDFGSIFSTLLPGTMAKLEPPEGCSFLDGLEVRVAFGSVWKQSLSELSGGQRSLLALSLILALLLFKPAPLYILDEVDAALDLSHTQNIGRMIKAHFPHSQFIVVSLKEGMFNNANVLFRTKFVDGVSTVQRTVAAKPSR
ncbi:RecF/RecN/SMC [Corchorus olitorius]|uniref:Structural maintenance of chromosomes protein n=1 Tax=Corchorus olitorius TaxID=93759 RepID=A0A1R3JTD8_9ROSI|nr:RecF/RecN/SMC [Corchorus olitorius]